MDSRVLKGGPRLIAVQVQRNRAEQHMAPLPLPLRAAALPPGLCGPPLRTMRNRRSYTF